ncbi:hypothetical protein EJ04DRAFT_561542, partial [Polyplosphaeria fusca]
MGLPKNASDTAYVARNVEKLTGGFDYKIDLRIKHQKQRWGTLQSNNDIFIQDTDDNDNATVPPMGTTYRVGSVVEAWFGTSDNDMTWAPALILDLRTSKTNRRSEAWKVFVVVAWYCERNDLPEELHESEVFDGKQKYILSNQCEVMLAQALGDHILKHRRQIELVDSHVYGLRSKQIKPVVNDVKAGCVIARALNNPVAQATREEEEEEALENNFNSIISDGVEEEEEGVRETDEEES